MVTELHGLDPAKVHVIPNGRNAYHFVPPDDEQRVAARAELGIDADGPVIGYVGSLSWEKRPELAIAAVADLPEVTLVIAGDGPLRAEVAEAARRIGPRVQVLGTVADSRTVMWAIDVLLLTSRTEGMPGVVIEAGLCGVPAVAPDVGGTRDLVSASTGRLLSPTDPASEFGTAVAAVLPQSQELGWAALAHCTAGFTLQASVERWSTLLRQGGERSARGGGPPG